MPAAVIAGTLLYDIPGFNLIPEEVETPYGEVQVFKLEGELQEELYFLPRHGLGHDIPPHKINYRANLKALELLGVKRVLAANAVGSINRLISPLDLVIVSDFIDFTSGRHKTFFDGGDSGVKHIDVSSPYCPSLRKQLLELSSEVETCTHARAVYVCTNGPRLETPAEIKMFKLLGGDIVGMTGIPEAVLARELGLCYAAVAFSINWAAGYQDTIEISREGEQLERTRTDLLKLLLGTVEKTSDQDCCQNNQ